MSKKRSHISVDKKLGEQAEDHTINVEQRPRSLCDRMTARRAAVDVR